MIIQPNPPARGLFSRLRLYRAIIGVAAIVALLVPAAIPYSVQAQYLPLPGTPLPASGSAAGGTTTSQQFFEPPKCKSGRGDSPIDTRGTGQANQGEYCINLATTAQTRDGAKNTQIPTVCAKTYAEWLQNPHKDFWVEDPDVTALGKGGERSREFLLWTLTRQSIDDHPVILDTWKLAQNVALFLVLIIVIIMGIGIIIGQQGIGFLGSNFNFSVDVTPLIIRVVLLLLYIIFSARIVLLFIQLSDVTMEFFIRTLKVRELFNIYFLDTSGTVKSLSDGLTLSEKAYKEFLGCTNWNINNQEMVTTSKALIKFTNMTYYFIGGMFIVRKVVLWFLLMVSPFLAILAPFVFVRNVGWIWIGVFFQWIFYGPLMALFLGGLAKIWNSGPVHIPYIFDFSRVNDMAQVVYPTSINILYGGPAQQLGIFNTSNYVDTFTEYIISLIMLWVVLILPWWLLRIFRDYCCDGIYSMKNILLQMYDQMRTPGGPGPTPTPTTGPTGTGSVQMKIPDNIKTSVQTNVKLETVQEIKQAQTQQIARSINVEASNLADIARMETNKVSRENVVKNLNQIQNPFKAETPTERQRLMNLRNEIQSRASQGDQLAQRLAAVTSQSTVREKVSTQKLIQTLPAVAVPATVNVVAQVPAARQQSIVQTVMNYAGRQATIVQALANQAQVSVEQAGRVLQTFMRNVVLDTSEDTVVAKTAQEVGMKEEQVKRVVSQAAVLMKARPDLLEAVARQEGVDIQTVLTVLQKAGGVSDKRSMDIVRKVLAQVAADPQAIAAIAAQAGMQAVQIAQILQALGSSNQLDVSLKSAVEEAAAAAGVKAEQVRKVATQAAYVVKSQTQVVQTVAQAENVEQQAVQDVVAEKMDAVSKADKEIEDYVPQTQKVTIEDYEEVKSMWEEHYTTAEIPVTENVSTREEWVEQDVVRITNILNKLMSANSTLQAQGLEEVGYILPVFMINNLTGEELLVYLKAKISAAKQVSKDLAKEAEVAAKIKSEEEVVEIERPKAAEAAKTQTLTNELPEEE